MKQQILIGGLVLGVVGGVGGGATHAHAATITVFANNPGGDAFTNATTTVLGEAVGTTGWFYNNVRNFATVGIDDTYARSGNGSVFFEGTVGPGGNSSKADIEYLAGGTNVGGNYYATSSLGLLSELTTLSYEWFRDSSSTNSNLQHPVIRILIDADGDLTTTGDRGGLVFERAYNGGAPVPTDQWVTDTIGGQTNLWSFGAGMGFAFGGYNKTLADWIAGFTGSTISGNSLVLGISLGIGSGWGPFVGAIDNVTVGFGNESTTFNFELDRAQVPEPSSLALVGLALIAGVVARRRFN